MTTPDSQSRRSFLIDAARLASTAWMLSELPLLASCARDSAGRGADFVHLSASEGRTLRAFAAQILPSDDKSPGAEEAGAAYFIDHAFALPSFAASLQPIRAGLADLERRAIAADERGGFASLAGSKQIAIMHEIENTPFFATARTLVIVGTFADPSHGGNRGGAGWTLLGIEHRPTFTAPFGWYDGQMTSATQTGVT